jgi:hypothetical protein
MFHFSVYRKWKDKASNVSNSISVSTRHIPICIIKCESRHGDLLSILLYFAFSCNCISPVYISLSPTSRCKKCKICKTSHPLLSSSSDICSIVSWFFMIFERMNFASSRGVISLVLIIWSFIIYYHLMYVHKYGVYYS